VAGEGSLDNLARGFLERAQGLSRMECRQGGAKRGLRPKPSKLAVNSRLCREVQRGLRANWSPKQIAARLICDYPDDSQMRVSHETIYRTLFVQARGALRKELTAASEGDGRSDVRRCGLKKAVLSGSRTWS